jgi:hypothetical protein
LNLLYLGDIGKKSIINQIFCGLVNPKNLPFFMVKDNEGHGFHNGENRFDFYRAMEQFLGRHLGRRVEQVETKK